MDDREKREERKRVFEDRMIDLLQAEALAMALDGPLNEWRSGLDSLGSLGKDERELLCKAIIEKCGIRGAVMLTELSESALPDRGETLLLHVINDRGGIATLDQVLVGLYRKTGEVMKRTTLTSKLYRMTQKGTVFVVPSKKGVYSTRRLSQEDVAAMFGEDQQDAG